MRKSLDWGNLGEMETLQKRLKAQIRHGIKLVDVIHVMLQRRYLPIQLRTTPMWLYKSEDVATVRNLFRTNLDGMWMTLFKLSKNKFPKKGEDCGLDAEHGPSEVKVVHSWSFYSFPHLMSLNRVIMLASPKSGLVQ